MTFLAGKDSTDDRRIAIRHEKLGRHLLDLNRGLPLHELREICSIVFDFHAQEHHIVAGNMGRYRERKRRFDELNTCTTRRCRKKRHLLSLRDLSRLVIERGHTRLTHDFTPTIRLHGTEPCIQIDQPRDATQGHGQRTGTPLCTEIDQEVVLPGLVELGSSVLVHTTSQTNTIGEEESGRIPRTSRCVHLGTPLDTERVGVITRCLDDSRFDQHLRRRIVELANQLSNLRDPFFGFVNDQLVTRTVYLNAVNGWGRLLQYSRDCR